MFKFTLLYCLYLIFNLNLNLNLILILKINISLTKPKLNPKQYICGVNHEIFIIPLALEVTANCTEIIVLNLYP